MLYFLHESLNCAAKLISIDITAKIIIAYGNIHFINFFTVTLIATANFITFVTFFI